MGTSTAHPSPRTAEWDYVRDAYREGIRDAAEVSRRIANALSVRTRAQMMGTGPSICLDTLLEMPPDPAGSKTPSSSGWAADLGLAAGLRARAERRIALGGHASLFSDIALDALGLSAMTAFEGGAQTASRTQLGQLAGLFLGSDLERCFQYFVSRDISQFVGSEAFPTVLSGRRLADEVADHCKRASVGLIGADNEHELRAALAIPGEDGRLAAVRDILGAGIYSSLDMICSSQGSRKEGRASGRSISDAASDDEDVGGDVLPLLLLAQDELEAETDYLPVYSLQAAAGYFGAGEGVESLGFLPSPAGFRAREGMFVCRIVGRSMEPRIADGAYAVFRAPVVGSRQGRIVLAQKRGFSDPDTGGSYTVKRYESVKVGAGDSWEHLAIRLVPENPEYDPIEVTAEEAEDLEIIAEFVTVLNQA